MRDILTRSHISHESIANYCLNTFDLSKLDDCNVDWERFSSDVHSTLNATVSSSNESNSYHLVVNIANDNVLWLWQVRDQHEDDQEGKPSVFYVVNFESNALDDEVPGEILARWAFPFASDRLLLVTDDGHYCIVILSAKRLQCDPLKS